MSYTAISHLKLPANVSACSTHKTGRAITSTTGSAENTSGSSHGTRPSAARPSVVGFEVVIQGGADESLQDVTHGADSKFRYILPVKDVTNEAKVTQVALYRLNEDMKTRPDGWAGCTSNINKDRDTVTLLYLVWKTAT